MEIVYPQLVHPQPAQRSVSRPPRTAYFQAGRASLPVSEVNAAPREVHSSPRSMANPFRLSREVPQRSDTIYTAGNQQRVIAGG